MWHLIFCFRQATQAVIFRLMSMGLRSPKDSRRACTAVEPESVSILVNLVLMGWIWYYNEEGWIVHRK